MPFSKEDKIRWDELALSLQDKLEKMSKRGEEYYNIHIKDVYNKISNNTTAISKESNERKQADKNLQSNIDTVKSDLATETKNRQSAESTIQSNIATLKNETTANLSALNGKITNATNKIDGKQFVKSKDGTNNIELKYEKKGSDTTASLHAYVDGQDIPLSSAGSGGSGGGLGAMPDYAKGNHISISKSYTFQEDCLAYCSMTTSNVQNPGLKLNNTSFTPPFYEITGSNSSQTVSFFSFFKRGDVLYAPSNIQMTYYPLSKNLSDDRSEKLVKCIAGFGVPEYTKKRILLSYDSQTSPTSSDDMYAVMPEDGYIYCIYDHGKYYNTPYGADITVEGMENTLESGTVVPVSQGSKIHVTINRGYRVRVTIYFIPIKHTGEATAPDYTDMREMMNETNWSSGRTIPMPSDGYMQIITNLDDVLSMKINNHTITFAGPSSPLYPVAAGDYISYNYTGGTFKIIYIPLKGGSLYRTEVVVPDLNRPIKDNTTISSVCTGPAYPGLNYLVTITFKKPCVYYIVYNNQIFNIIENTTYNPRTDAPRYLYSDTERELMIHDFKIANLKVYCFEPYSIKYTD